MSSRKNTMRYQKQKANPRQTIGLLLLVCTSVLPALLITGFVTGTNTLNFSFSTWLIIAVVGGALGGALMMKLKFWYVGMIAGVLIGPGMLIATYLYTAHRSAILTIEIVIPMVIGALPGLLFLFAVFAIYGKRRRARNAMVTGPNMAVAPNQPYTYQQNAPYQQPPNNQPPR